MSEQDIAVSTETETRDGAAQDTTQTTEADKSEGTITITQSEIDRIVQKAVQKNMDSQAVKLEEERKRIEAESRKAQLESEGKYKELLSETNAEVASLRAQNESREYKLTARQKLDEMGMGGFFDVLVTNTVEPIETTMSRAEKLKATFDAETQSALEKRLDTGSHIAKKSNPVNTKTPDQLVGDDYLAWKKSRDLV